MTSNSPCAATEGEQEELETRLLEPLRERGDAALREVYASHKSRNNGCESRPEIASLLCNLSSSSRISFCEALVSVLQQRMPVANDDDWTESLRAATEFLHLAAQKGAFTELFPLAAHLATYLSSSETALTSLLCRTLSPFLSTRPTETSFARLLFPVLLSRSLDVTGGEASTTVADVRRIYAAREVLTGFDLSENGMDVGIRAQLLRTPMCSRIVTCADGQRFIAYLLGISVLRTSLFNVLIRQLGTMRKSYGVHFGNIFLLSWRSKGSMQFPGHY